jgi:hypothetical protein
METTTANFVQGSSRSITNETQSFLDSIENHKFVANEEEYDECEMYEADSAECPKMTREDATSTKSLDAYIYNNHKINDDLIFDFKFYENTFENLFAIGKRTATHHGIVICGNLKDGLGSFNRAFDMGLQCIKYKVGNRIPNLSNF